VILNDLYKGRFIKRYKRFFSDIQIEVNDEVKTVVAHCPNTGSMKSLIDLERELECLISKSNNPKRKLGWTFECLEIPNMDSKSKTSSVLINTRYPNYIVEEWLGSKMALEVLEVDKIISIKAEPKLGEGRSDFFVVTDKGNIWIEVKNVTYGYNGVVSFPDSVSTRASRHLGELESRVLEGERGIALFLVSRQDAVGFSLSNGIDAEFEKKLASVSEAGVEILPLKVGFEKNVMPNGLFQLKLEIESKLAIIS
jgi:sugar fermentation stimulation protein A